MAKYDVTYRCGHSARVELFGAHKERESKLDWMRGTLCPECYRAQKEAERQQVNAQAATANAAAGLPALVGTEKQVAWAESIRRTALAEAAKVRALDRTKVAASIDPRQIEVATAYLAAYDGAMSTLKTESSAKWWIDNREETDYMVRAAVDKAMVPYRVR